MRFTLTVIDVDTTAKPPTLSEPRSVELDTDADDRSEGCKWPLDVEQVHESLQNYPYGPHALNDRRKKVKVLSIECIDGPWRFDGHD